MYRQNECTLAGIITSDIVISEGKKDVVARFTVYTSEKIVNKETKKEEEYNRLFINCVAFGKKALSISSFYKKGEEVILKGPLQITSYESEGQKHKAIQIIIKVIAKQMQDILEHPPEFQAIDISDPLGIE